MTEPESATQPARRQAAFVAHSEIRASEDSVAALIAAFADRPGEVEQCPGFERLEVWQDERDDGRFVMVSWWDHKEIVAR